MIEQLPWCLIVNLNTCSPHQWKQWKNKLDKHHIIYTAHFCYTISDLSYNLSKLNALGNTHFLFAGGDGTLHHGGNLLIEHAGENAKHLVIGVLPCGTGNDWVRTFGIPRNKIIESLKRRKTQPLRLLKLERPDGSYRYIFNMAGAALDAAVVDTINKNKIYLSFGFLKYTVALLKTLLQQKQWQASIKVDDNLIEGSFLTLEFGFGKYCGGGMFVLPHAKINSPAFLLMKSKSLIKILISIRKLYNGNIADQPESISGNADSLEIVSPLLPIEADGEWQGYSPVRIYISDLTLNRLISD